MTLISHSVSIMGQNAIVQFAQKSIRIVENLLHS